MTTKLYNKKTMMDKNNIKKYGTEYNVSKLGEFKLK